MGMWDPGKLLLQIIHPLLVSKLKQRLEYGLTDIYSLGYNIWDTTITLLLNLNLISIVARPIRANESGKHSTV